MTVESNQDETQGFVTTSSDMPEDQAVPQESQDQGEEASPKTEATEGNGEQGQEGSAEGKKAEKQDDDTGEDAAAEHDKAKKPNGVQKRIDKVAREREEARREKEALEQRIKELESGKQNKGGQEGSDKEPVESDFDTYDEYLDALDAYDNRQLESQEKSGKDDKEEQSQDHQPELTDSQKTAMAVIKEQVDSADKPDDFDEVALNPEVPVTGEMLEALAECEDPTKIMYHLGQNKDAAAEIAAGSPAQQMRAIAKLDMTVGSKPPKPAKTTSAPDPIAPVSGGGDAQEKSPEDMSFAEYEAYMNKQQKARKSW